VARFILVAERKLPMAAALPSPGAYGAWLAVARFILVAERKLPMAGGPAASGSLRSVARCCSADSSRRLANLQELTLVPAPGAEAPPQDPRPKTAFTDVRSSSRPKTHDPGMRLTPREGPPYNPAPFSKFPWHRRLHLLLMTPVAIPRWGVWLVCGAVALAGGRCALAQGVELPPPPLEQPIQVQAAVGVVENTAQARRWALTGPVLVRQGDLILRADAGVLWQPKGRYGELLPRLEVFLSGHVELVRGQGQQVLARWQGPSWMGRLESLYPPRVQLARKEASPAVQALLQQAETSRRVFLAQEEKRPPVPAVQQVRYLRLAQAPAPAAEPVPAAASPVPPGTRRLRAWPRSNVPIQATWFPDPQRGEWVAVITSGINLVIEGAGELGLLDIAADRMVIWTAGNQQPDLAGGTTQGAETPLEIYMEGNIVFRQGQRLVQAQRMYYDVRRRVGMILDAELLTPLPQQTRGGMLRMRAAVIRQLNQSRFQAQDAWITTSRMGQPTYRIRSDTVTLEDRQQMAVDPVTGSVLTDPATGQVVVRHRRMATAANNFVLLGNVPVFYWPVLAADLERPEFYIRRARLKNDRIFGTQLLTDWAPYQILGIENPPDGTDWDLSLDYLSNRGWGHGTRFEYAREGFFGLPGPYAGFIDYWGIAEQDLDTLGADRTALVPEASYRFRLLGRHRWFLAPGYQLTAEVGVISDRNFLEQYFETEWDTFKDQTTALELKRLDGLRSWSLEGAVRTNDFFTQTQGFQWKHTWLGQPLLGGWLHWYERTQLGYVDLKTASTPTDPVDAAKFALLPWERDREGARLVTTHEVEMPLQLGPVHLAPYAMGQLGHWGEDLAGNRLDRAYGQVGLRASLPMWRVDPAVESDLWNVHGLAHKVVFTLDAFAADAEEDFTRLPLYDPLDEDAQEHFRRRFQFDTFGGSIPTKFDERYYALRSGLGTWVTSPSAEIVDDLAVVRLGAHQRWQTRRGMPGARHVVDWIVLDTQVSLFPNANRDNFGQELGLAEYDFRWHVGDRLTLMSDGLFDFFGSGARFVRVGSQLTRPPRGHLYLGFRSLQGPINSQVLVASWSYWMSPKWISTFSTSVDFGENNNIGQALTLTRVGESFLITVGLNVDANKNNVGVNLAIEPRFLPGVRLGRVRTRAVPVAGSQWLE